MDKMIQIELTPSWKKAIAFSKRVRAEYERDFGKEDCGEAKTGKSEGQEFEGNGHEAFNKEQT